MRQPSTRLTNIKQAPRLKTSDEHQSLSPADCQHCMPKQNRAQHGSVKARGSSPCVPCYLRLFVVDPNGATDHWERPSTQHPFPKQVRVLDTLQNTQVLTDSQGPARQISLYQHPFPVSKRVPSSPRSQHCPSLKSTPTLLR